MPRSGYPSWFKEARDSYRRQFLEHNPNARHVNWSRFAETEDFNGHNIRNLWLRGETGTADHSPGQQALRHGDFGRVVELAVV